MELIKLDHKEDSRKYHFKDDIIEFFDVIEFAASKSTHRLKLSDGRLIIIPTEGLRYIEIKSKDFTI